MGEGACQHDILGRSAGAYPGRVLKHPPEAQTPNISDYSLMLSNCIKYILRINTIDLNKQHNEV